MDGRGHDAGCAAGCSMVRLEVRPAWTIALETVQKLHPDSKALSRPQQRKSSSSRPKAALLPPQWRDHSAAHDKAVRCSGRDDVFIEFLDRFLDTAPNSTIRCRISPLNRKSARLSALLCRGACTTGKIEGLQTDQAKCLFWHLQRSYFGDTR